MYFFFLLCNGFSEVFFMVYGDIKIFNFRCFPKGIFLSGNLPRVTPPMHNIPSGNFPSLFQLQRSSPFLILAAALVPLAHPSRNTWPLIAACGAAEGLPNIRSTFGKLLFGKCHNLEVSIWEIVDWELPEGKYITTTIFMLLFAYRCESLSALINGNYLGC